MKKILVIGASNSKNSINKKLALFTANQLEDVSLMEADLNELTLPIYSPDLEAEAGIPENAKKFLSLIDASDAIVLSLAEHNGLVTAAFKNLWDWASRVEVKLWKNKPMFLMATSPGGRGAANTLRVTKDLIPHFGGNVITDFSLPSFNKNFTENGIADDDLAADFKSKIELFQNSI